MNGNEFINRDGDRWFRVQGDQFMAGDSEGLALEAWFAGREDNSVPLSDLRNEYPEGRLL